MLKELFSLESIKQMWLPVLILLLCLWWLNNRFESIDKRLQNCEADKFAIITANNERSSAVIQKNTEALNQNTETMARLQILLNWNVKSGRKPIIAITAHDAIK